MAQGLTALRLVVSRDAGRTWQAVGGRQTWLPHHPDDDGFDRLVFSTAPLRVDDELRFTTPATTAITWCSTKTARRSTQTGCAAGGPALATLRADGYVSRGAVKTTGQLVTKTVRFEGSRLTVNAAVSRGALASSCRTKADGRFPASLRPIAVRRPATALPWRSAGTTIPTCANWPAGPCD